MEMLPKWVLPPTLPSIYDHESFTALEMVAKVYGAMNTLIEEYTAFASELQAAVTEFKTKMENDSELFAIGLRQEFQDFIDVVELRLDAQDKALAELSVNTEQIARDIVNTAIKSGSLYVVEEYDPATEELKLIVSGGV